MDKKKKITGFLNRYGRWITGLGVLLCAVGLVLGYMKPKQKLETVAVNMSEEGEADVALEEGTILDYVCSTKGYPMAGIQVGIRKYGQELTDSVLLCRVYDESGESLLSETLVALKDVDEGQYVYIPFENYKQCSGTIRVEFSCSAPEGAACGLAVNTVLLSDASTLMNGKEAAFGLKAYYVYKLDYYPLMFDLLTMLMLFLGVFLLGSGKERAADE